VSLDTGIGLATSESYVSVAELKAYRPRGGLTLPTATDEALELALIRATAAVDALFASRWPGSACSADQALEWPRYDALDARGYEIDSEVIPQAVKNATCEAALIELAEAGALSKAQARGGAVQSETVGPLSTTYFPGAPAGTVYIILKQCLSRILPTGLQARRG
jgi:hypothetical protein